MSPVSNFNRKHSLFIMNPTNGFHGPLKQISKRLLVRRSPRLQQKAFLASPQLTNSPTLTPQFQHLPKIKSHVATIADDGQKRMKRLREATLPLCSIENLKPPKRKIDEVDIANSGNLTEPVEAKKSRKSSIGRVMSFATMFSPRSSLRKKETSLQRSTSLKSTTSTRSLGLSRSGSKKNSFSMPVTPTKKRETKFWIDTIADNFDGCIHNHLSSHQIKRQEVIFELCCGEEDLVEDLKLVKQVYINPMSKLNILKKGDLKDLSGNLDAILPLHEDLARKLNSVRNNNGSIDDIGQLLLDWVPGLKAYAPYCAQQIYVKDLLDHKQKEDKAVADFLQRCLESPFSRKLDFWSFLDAPRSRLVKYPILFEQIRRCSPPDSEDTQLISSAIHALESIITKADYEAGKANCLFFKSRFYYLHDDQRSRFIDRSDAIVCHGALKNKNGTKLHAFLFNTCFVLTRPATRHGILHYQVYAQPLINAELQVDDLPDGDVRIGGSFKTSITKGGSASHVIRVFGIDPIKGRSFVLQARDEHDKKQWMNAFRSVVDSEDCIRVMV